MNLDYETLRLLFWCLLTLCVSGFIMTEGLLLGCLMQIPIQAQLHADREALLKAISPAVFGSLNWLLATLALTAAAWPIFYASLFSSFKVILLFLLICVLNRTLGLLFRMNIKNLKWRSYWDKSIAISSVFASGSLGLICGNQLKGVPFHFDSDMQIFFLGSFWEQLNPFALLVSASSVALFMMYGSIYLQIQNSTHLSGTHQRMIFKSGFAFLVLFALAGLWISHLEGYHISSEVFSGAASNPLNKFVKRGEGLWLDNYEHQPTLWVFPTITMLSVTAAMIFSHFSQFYLAMLATTVSIFFAIVTVAISMFPFLLPSNRSLNSSLTIWDASASYNTLSTMLSLVTLALPLMILISRSSFHVSTQTENTEN
jgi:cytochrome bd ubiquinol oxidase subunit II